MLAGYTETMTCVTPVYRVAPTLCMPPPASGARMSRAEAGSPHGRKLYHLYVSDPAAYAAALAGENPAPVGMTLIKESHEARLPQNGEAMPERYGTQGLVPGEITELFAMTKVGGEDTPGTDGGWVYRVAHPDGRVYVSGVIESCVRCHAHAKHDRLFGLAPATTVYFE